jgi:hypothetical protein
MYSINVFVTFSLASSAWCSTGRDTGRNARPEEAPRVFITGFVFCVVILAVTIYEKFLDGGWVTILVTSTLVLFCIAMKAYYRRVGRKIAQLSDEIGSIREENPVVPAFNRRRRRPSFWSTRTARSASTRFSSSSRSSPLLQELPLLSVGTLTWETSKGGRKSKRSNPPRKRT